MPVQKQSVYFVQRLNLRRKFALEIEGTKQTFKELAARQDGIKDKGRQDTHSLEQFEERINESCLSSTNFTTQGNKALTFTNRVDQTGQRLAMLLRKINETRIRREIKGLCFQMIKCLV